MLMPRIAAIRRTTVVFVCVAIVLSVIASQTASAADPASGAELFETKIRPVLVDVCFKCHGGEKVSGALRVDSLDALLKGGDSGPSIVVAKPGESGLLKAIRHEDKDFKMPPDKKLPDETIAAFEAWIAAGAVWPQGKAGPFEVKRHWAFQPISRPAVPETRNTKHEVRSAIDAFVLQKLEAAGLTLSPPADRHTWIRRATFDLHGLPPTLDELAEFDADNSPQAFERVIDRLLASSRYGERWGRFWLDISRYADTKGYVFMEDRNYPFAYKYRDWVVNSLNEDVGYDQFLIRQMAADLLPEPEKTANLPALGFLTLGRRFLNNINDIIDDRIDVICRGTMALTVGCARCHDHKFDPIPASDYYSLYGVLRSSHEPKPEEAKTLMAMALVEDENPFDPYVFLRGQQHNHGPKVPRQFLSVVSGPDRKPFANKSGRLELAQAIASPTNPLTARVLVNRVWMQHFGSPLVRTPSDFGLRCEPPSHLELLDWLCTELIAHNWSLKWLHREILLSSVWRQGTEQGADEEKRGRIDPENRLLSRMNRRRMDWESLRDSLLFVSGKLDHSIGGTATDVLKPPFATRRTIYGFIDRQNLPLVLRTFDFASPDAHSPSRFITSVPQQTLFLRNSSFVIEQARSLAARTTDGSRGNIPELFRAVYGRDPSAEEITLAEQFLADATHPTEAIAPLWQYGFGEYDVAAKALKNFTTLPHWTGSGWQGGPKLPDEKIGWVLWNAAGGHPGKPSHSAIARWTAPQDATVVITGELKHNAEAGDGVMAIVWSARQGERVRWTAHKQSVNTFAPAIQVKRGESLDFIVFCQANEHSDSFNWSPKLASTDKRFQKVWDFSADFPKGPNPQTPDAPLTPWEQLAQVLLLSNEFQFVD